MEDIVAQQLQRLRYNNVCSVLATYLVIQTKYQQTTNIERQCWLLNTTKLTHKLPRQRMCCRFMSKNWRSPGQHKSYIGNSSVLTKAY